MTTGIRWGNGATIVNRTKSWDAVRACKMFFKCDAAELVEQKTGATGTPVSANTLGYDAAKYALTSSGWVVPDSLVPSSFSTWTMNRDFRSLKAGKSSMMLFAGYFDLQPGDTETNGCRVSIAGDGANPDGTAQPRWGIASEHVLLSIQDPLGSPGDILTSGASYTASNHGGLSEKQSIEASVGAGGYFYKFAIYRPDGNIMEVRLCNGTTGATITSYELNTYGGVILTEDIVFQKALKLAGVKTTGIVRLDWDSVPANYLTLAHQQVAEWAIGNKIVISGWDS